MRTQNTNVRRLASLLVMVATAAAACGDIGTTAAEPATPSSVVATTQAPTTTAVPPTTAASTTTTMAPTTTAAPATTTAPDTTTTTTLAAELPLLEDSLGETVGDFQLVQAGVYASRALPVPLVLDLQEFQSAAVTVREGSLVGLTLPAHGWRTHPVLVLAVPSGLPEPGKAGVHDDNSPGSVPVESAADIDALFETTEGLVLLDQGEDEVANGAAWWEFSTDPAVGGGFSCPHGTNCFNIVVTPGIGNFFAGEEFTYRMWQLGDSGLYAWLQAPSEQWEYALELGPKLLAGISIGEEA